MRFFIAAVVTILVLPSLRVPLLGGGPEKLTPPQMQACVVLEFWPLTLIGVPDHDTPVRLKVVAADGTISDNRVGFQGMSKSAGNDVATSLEDVLERTNWHVVRTGDRIVVFSHLDPAGKKSPIKEVHFSSGGAYPVEMLPTVIATENVTVIRDEKKAAQQKAPKDK